MSSELERRIQERLPGLPLTGATKRALRDITTETGIAVFASDAAAVVRRNDLKNTAAIAEQSMEYTAALVDKMRRLAGDDQAKLAVMVPILQEFTEQARQANRADNNLLGW